MARGKAAPRRKQAVAHQQKVMLTTHALRILDQYRAKLEHGSVTPVQLAAARRAVLVLDALVWARPIRLDEALDMVRS